MTSATDQWMFRVVDDIFSPNDPECIRYVLAGSSPSFFTASNEEGKEKERRNDSMLCRTLLTLRDGDLEWPGRRCMRCALRLD